MSDCFDHAFDAYDDLCFGRTADEGLGLSRRTGEWQSLGKTCKFCGMTDLHWHQKDGKWKLCIKGKPHECKPKEQKLEAFYCAAAEIGKLGADKGGVMTKLKTDQEPVAWWNGKYTSAAFSINKGAPGIGDSGIPLYTHPSRTLSDAEIELIWNMTEFHGGDDWNAALEFARAVLEASK